MANSYQSVALTVVNDKIIQASFFTNSDKAASDFMNSAKTNGFKYFNSITAANGMTDMAYHKDNYLLVYNKKYYPEDEQSSFYITLEKLR